MTPNHNNVILQNKLVTGFIVLSTTTGCLRTNKHSQVNTTVKKKRGKKTSIVYRAMRGIKSKIEALGWFRHNCDNINYYLT